MIIIAALVLPAVTLLLFGMDRIEEWLSRPAHSPAPHPAHAASGRHLRLLPRPRRGRDGVAAAPGTLDSGRKAA